MQVYNTNTGSFTGVAILGMMHPMITYSSREDEK
jgi:hypothetical protein